MLNGPSEHPVQLEPPKKSSIHFVVPEKIKCLTPANIIERLLAKHGILVAKYPWVYIVGCLVLTIVSGLGLSAFRWENNIVRLWNPTGSETGQNFAWLWKNHPPDLRKHSVMLYTKNNGNVLTKNYLLKMFDVRQMLYEAVGDNNVTWNSACLKVPLVPSKYSDFVKNKEEVEPVEDDYEDPFAMFETDDDFENFENQTDADLSVEFYPEPYCTVYNSFDNICFEDSLLELFAQNGKLTRDMIENIETSQDILDKINDETNQYSGLYSVVKDFQSLVGGIEYDNKGKIKSARAVRFDMFGKMNVTEAHLDAIRRKSVLADQLAIDQMDDNTRSIETKFIQLLLNERNQLETTDLNLDFIVAKSFADAINERITGEIPKALGSFAIMFIYVTLALGKLNCTDNKSLLSMAGLFSVLMALVTSYGICSILGFFISPLHNFIPFLLLGLGVDDMFVIVQAFKQLEPAKDRSELPSKISKTLTNSGVSITVTSLTDLLAFVVGSTTTVPALESFCIFCGLGIFVVYIYQITWFTAWLVIDQRRMLAKRNACFPCFKISESDEDTKPKCQTLPKVPDLNAVEKCTNFLSLKATKVFVVVCTLGLMATSIYGNYMIEEEFDPWLFLDPYSYPAAFKANKDRYFPEKGENVLLFFSGNITQHNLHSMDSLVTRITSEASQYVNNVDSWVVGFRNYYVSNLGHSQGLAKEENIDQIHSALAQFLYSPNGGQYQYLFTFDGDLKCGQILPPVYITIMQLTHRHFNTSSKGIEAMNTIKHLMRSSGFQGRVFPFSPMYSIWEIDEIIRGELYRNICMASLAITIATIFLLSDLVSACFVILCVFITLTNVSGIMYFWGLNIDTVTSTVLIVCIGLSVDFSVHVIHSFMHADGHSRDARMKKALLAIAPAVLNGGFSTFLAVALLAFSDVYVFVSFFKVFFLVVFFGLYNGLVFLPVILTLIGPKNMKTHQDNSQKLPQNNDTHKLDHHELASLNNSSAEEK